MASCFFFVMGTIVDESPPAGTDVFLTAGLGDGGALENMPNGANGLISVSCANN